MLRGAEPQIQTLQITKAHKTCAGAAEGLVLITTGGKGPFAVYKNLLCVPYSACVLHSAGSSCISAY